MSFFNARSFRIAIVPFPSSKTGRHIGNYSSHITPLFASSHVACFGPRNFCRGKKTKSTFDFSDLPHGLDLRPLEPLQLERSIIEDAKSAEKASLELFEDVQDILEESELSPAESEELPNPVASMNSEEVEKKEKPVKRTRRAGSLPQGLIALDSDTLEAQESRDTPSPLAGDNKIKEKKASNDVGLLQGLLPLEPLEIEHEPPPYPTVIMQARSNMLKFENCVVVTRVGGFYELYFEHADEFGPLLGLKVAHKKTNAGPVSMVSSRVILSSSNIITVIRLGFLSINLTGI